MSRLTVLKKIKRKIPNFPIEIDILETFLTSGVLIKGITTSFNNLGGSDGGGLFLESYVHFLGYPKFYFDEVGLQCAYVPEGEFYIIPIVCCVQMDLHRHIVLKVYVWGPEGL